MTTAIHLDRAVVLVLDGIPQGTAEALSGATVYRASTPFAAGEALAHRRPDVIVADAHIPWQRLFLSGLPDERRPAVLAHGFSADVRAAWADEWVSARPEPGEIAVRVRLARERAQIRRQRARRALVDPLTRLPNRRAVIRTLVHEAARARRGKSRLGLVLVDLDGFKAINDRFGHAEGDRVLRRVGQALSGVTREDELCGRIGGDEFAIAVGGGLEAASHAAARAAEALEASGVHATFAAGELRPFEPLRTLYRRVDEQLCAHKRARRSRRAERARGSFEQPRPTLSPD